MGTISSCLFALALPLLMLAANSANATNCYQDCTYTPNPNDSDCVTVCTRDPSNSGGAPGPQWGDASQEQVQQAARERQMIQFLEETGGSSLVRQIIEQFSNVFGTRENIFLEEQLWINSLFEDFCSPDLAKSNDESECREAVNIGCRYWLKTQFKRLVQSLGSLCQVTQDGGWNCPKETWFDLYLTFIRVIRDHKSPSFNAIQAKIHKNCERYTLDEDKWLESHFRKYCLPNSLPSPRDRECYAAVNGTCKNLLRGRLRGAVSQLGEPCLETEEGWECATASWVPKQDQLEASLATDAELAKVKKFISNACRSELSW